MMEQHEASAPSVIDHLVVVSPDLTTGSEWIAGELGAQPVAGGSHVRMGTHNRLLRTGPTTYLEVIAPEPGAPSPDTPRWFGLDEMSDTPRLAAWVVRTDDISGRAGHLADILGPIEEMARGDLSWSITIPRDGLPALDGAAPGVIQWDADTAATRLPESLAHLVSLTILHPQPDHVKALLASLDVVGPISVQADFGASLIAAFDTPAGQRLHSGPGHADLGIETERAVAMDLFHLTWRYLDMADRGTAHDLAMVQTAEASLWHWRRVGAATQWAIGEWQCSRVHAVLGDGPRSLHHAERCLAICESERVDDFVPASAHESMSRAYAVLGDMDAARDQRNLAYRIALELDDDDRDVIEHDLNTLPIP